MIIDPEIIGKVITHGIEAYPAIIHAQMKANIIEGLICAGETLVVCGGLIGICFVGMYIIMKTMSD